MNFLKYGFYQDEDDEKLMYIKTIIETYRHSSYKMMYDVCRHPYINVVFGADKTKYPIKLGGLTLDTLEKEILDKRETQFLNARKICLRDVTLTNDAILQLLHKDDTYRAHLTQPFEDCPDLCDIYLFKVIE